MRLTKNNLHLVLGAVLLTLLLVAVFQNSNKVTLSFIAFQFQLPLFFSGIDLRSNGARDWAFIGWETLAAWLQRLIAFRLEARRTNRVEDEITVADICYTLARVGWYQHHVPFTDFA
jgi:hypothetical protein